MPTDVIDMQTVNEVQWAANKQYRTRRPDETFASLDDLQAAVVGRRQRAIEMDGDIKTVKFLEDGQGGIAARVGQEVATPTHWAFGQTAALVQAPASYLRKLPTDLAVKCLNHGVEQREAAGFKFLMVDAENPEQDHVSLMATTSKEYGRIWDADVVAMTRQVIDEDGRFYSPWAWGREKKALWASDRNVFMYFIDGGSIVDAGRDRQGRQRQHNRGIYVWNSEVGDAVFGISTFTFDETCGNFQIWGIRDIKLLRIRHTSGGPAKFVNEALPALREYAASSVRPLEAAIQKARVFPLPREEKEFTEFFMRKAPAKFTAAEVRRAKTFAEQEEGACVTLWDFVNGVTASARQIAFADARADLEARAGKLMKFVSEDVR